MGPKFFIRPLSPRGEEISAILLQIIAQKPAEQKAHCRGVILSLLFAWLESRDDGGMRRNSTIHA